LVDFGLPPRKDGYYFSKAYYPKPNKNWDQYAISNWFLTRVMLLGMCDIKWYEEVSKSPGVDNLNMAWFTAKHRCSEVSTAIEIMDHKFLALRFPKLLTFTNATYSKVSRLYAETWLQFSILSNGVYYSIGTDLIQKELHSLEWDFLYLISTKPSEGYKYLIKSGTEEAHFAYIFFAHDCDTNGLSTGCKVSYLQENDELKREPEEVKIYFFSSYVQIKVLKSGEKILSFA